MFRVLLCFFILFLSVPAFAGPFEEAFKNNDKVLLYIYTPTCGYCKKFEPYYKRLLSAYGTKCKFVKVDGSTQYGATISYKYNVRYVPYVMLINTKTKKGNVVKPDCLSNYSCVSQKLDLFIK